MYGKYKCVYYDIICSIWAITVYSIWTSAGNVLIRSLSTSALRTATSCAWFLARSTSFLLWTMSFILECSEGPWLPAPLKGNTLIASRNKETMKLLYITTLYQKHSRQIAENSRDRRLWPSMELKQLRK